MDNNLFSKSFNFAVYKRRSNYHSDNSHGIDCNFIARMRRGRAVIESEQYGTLEVNEGELFLLPFGLKYHSFWYAMGGEVEFESYRFEFYPSYGNARPVLQKLLLTPEERAIADLLASDLTVNSVSVGRLFTLFGMIFPRLRLADADPRESLFNRAKDYISRHEDLRVPELARYIGMSESGVYAFFRSFGKSPIGVKNEMLAERAVGLLTRTDLSVEEISGRVGFSSVAHFRKIIRRVTGKTPLEIRREAIFGTQI